MTSPAATSSGRGARPSIRVAVREPAEALDDVAVLLCEVQHLSVAKRGEQQQRAVLVVHPSRYARTACRGSRAPAAASSSSKPCVDRALGDRQRQRIGRELVGMAAEHVARELVEQDHRRERRQRIGQEGFGRKLPLAPPRASGSACGCRRRAPASPFHHSARVEAEPEFEDVGAPVAAAQAAVPPTVRPSISRVGWPTPGGNALAALAADADAFVEREIVADALDPGEHGRSVADQRRALDRLADLAVSDPVGLGAGEDELAAGDVDLAAAEALGVDAVLARARPARPGSSLPASMKVLVMRGIGAWAKLSRRPLPVGSTPISRALSRSWR